MLKSDKTVIWKVVFFCLDNWVNGTNLDQKLNIWHFNGGKITFCALNDALVKSCNICLVWSGLLGHA